MKKLIVLAAALLSAIEVFACTNLIVTRGASADGSNMLTYAADSHTRYGYLYFNPAARFGKKDMREIFEWGPNRFLGKIPQVRNTYHVVGNMNEFQLMVGESTWGGLKDHVDPKGILDYGSLMYIALERCKSAKEAIHTIVDLANEYGYASSGESISLVDKEEAWILEMISKVPEYSEDSVNVNKGIVWAAARIPDGSISAHANCARITQIDTADSVNFMYAPDLFEYVEKQGLYEGEKAAFSFADTFCPLDFMAMRGCEARVWSFFNKFAEEDMKPYLDFARGDNPKHRLPLYVTPKKKISVKELADMMRDRFEGTEFDMSRGIGAGTHELPYRWRPMTYKVDGVENLNERAIATQQTGFWFVAQARKELPDFIGGLIWFGVDDAGTSPLTPVYASSKEISMHYSVENGSMVEYSPTSMFWLVNRIAQFAYLRYNQIGTEVRTIIDEHENAMIKKIQQADKDAYEMYLNSSQKKCVKYLTNVSVTCADYLFYKWSRLDEYLLVKFIDGNTKKQNADGSFTTNGFTDYVPAMPDFPGYSETFLRTVAASDEAKGQRVK